MQTAYGALVPSHETDLAADLHRSEGNRKRRVAAGRCNTLESNMTPEELDRIVEWNRVRCHRGKCHMPAVVVYHRTQRNAHGGQSVFTYQRCAEHPVRDADFHVPFDAAVVSGRSE